MTAPTVPEMKDGWIEWTGGENPVPGQMVRCCYSDGTCDSADWPSEEVSWGRGPEGPYFLAYRVVPAPTEKGDGLWPVGSWLSAALDDPSVCAEMKRDIREWFDGNGHMRPPASDRKGSTAHQIEMAVARETLRRAVVPPADDCGTSCNCTADCERAYAYPPEGVGS